MKGRYLRAHMERTLLICFACVGWIFATGQAHHIDSLRKQARAEGPTTVRVDLLVQLGMLIWDEEEQSMAALAPLEEAVTLSGKLRYRAGLGYEPCLAAMRAHHAGNHREAIDAWKMSIARLDSLHITFGRNSPLDFIRISFNGAGAQDERLAFYQAALDRYARIGPKENMASCYHGIAGYYVVSGQYGLGIENYLKAREIYLETDPYGALNEANVIGRAYNLWGNPDRAEPFLLEARDGYLQQQDPLTVMDCEIQLAHVELAQGDTAAAIRYLEGTRPMWPRSLPLQIAICRTRLAMMYVWTSQLEKARVEVDSVNAIDARFHLPLSSTNQNCEVDYCNYLFQRASGHPVEADHYLERALAAALSLKDVKLTLKYRLELSKRYKDTYRDGAAMEQLMLYTNLNDSLQAIANKGALAAYESTVKERKSAVEIERQQASIRQQRVVLFSVGGGLVLLMALAYSVHRGKKRSDELLLNILPAEVANELKAKGRADAKHYDNVSVLFSDFKGFTAMSEVVTPQQLVQDLNECFSAFDHITAKYGIEKIKTIGDAYMAAGGLPTPNTTHAVDVIKAALEIRDFIAEGKALKIAAGLPYFEIRIGIHTGPVVAGIVGVKKFSYDIWGDTVNTASRMESSGEVGQVNISEATYALVKSETGLTFTPRGKVQAKGKGEMEMYFVQRA